MSCNKTQRSLEQDEPLFCICDRKLKGKIKGRKKKKVGCEKVLDDYHLKTNLEECIKKFDQGRPDLQDSLAKLNAFISNKETDQECYPKSEWPYCPPKLGPDAFPSPHPYIPGVIMYSKPVSKPRNVKVTLDGRLAEPYQPRKYYHDEPPLNVPPWVLPRYKSQELRGGLLLKGCQCWKKNGLQDDCPRWDCGGRPECRIKPLPACPPGMAPPVCGVRKPNLYESKPDSCRNIKPPPPFPVVENRLINSREVPEAPSVPCPYHEDM